MTRVERRETYELTNTWPAKLFVVAILAAVLAVTLLLFGRMEPGIGIWAALVVLGSSRFMAIAAMRGLVQRNVDRLAWKDGSNRYSITLSFFWQSSWFPSGAGVVFMVGVVSLPPLLLPNFYFCVSAYAVLFALDAATCQIRAVPLKRGEPPFAFGRMWASLGWLLILVSPGLLALTLLVVGKLDGINGRILLIFGAVALVALVIQGHATVVGWRQSKEPFPTVYGTVASLRMYLRTVGSVGGICLFLGGWPYIAVQFIAGRPMDENLWEAAAWAGLCGLVGGTVLGTVLYIARILKPEFIRLKD